GARKRQELGDRLVEWAEAIEPLLDDLTGLGRRLEGLAAATEHGADRVAVGIAGEAAGAPRAAARRRRRGDGGGGGGAAGGGGGGGGVVGRGEVGEGGGRGAVVYVGVRQGERLGGLGVHGPTVFYLAAGGRWGILRLHPSLVGRAGAAMSGGRWLHSADGWGW